MIIKSEDMKKEIRNKMRGGTGDIEFTHFVNKDDLVNARLLSQIVIPVGGSIGDHRHDNEVEYYIIIKGSGVVIDNGIEKEVKEGDVVVTAHGSTHSIRNSGDKALVMIAIIILY